MSVINTLRNKHQSFQKKFALVWAAMTFAFMATILALVWQDEHNKIWHKFDLQAHSLVFQLEEIFENIVDSLDAVPLYANENADKNCLKLRPYLEQMVFNSLYVSGLVISTRDDKVLCTSEGGLVAVPQHPSKQSPVLLGPLNHQYSKSEVYFLQKNYAKHQIGALLLRSLFDDFFQKNAKNFDFIGLYDSNTHKMLYKKGLSFPDENLKGLPLHTEIVRESKNHRYHEAVLSLNNVDNIALVVQKPVFNYFMRFISQSLLYLLPLLFLSWWLYHVSKEIIRKRFSIHYALSTALKEERFFPLYQPIRDLENNNFCGAEILMRWRTEFDETIMPDHFIDDAEKSGLIVPMTLQLMETVFKECQGLFQEDKPPTLSFNLSPAHFEEAQFFSNFDDLCEKYAIPPQKITLELTERGLITKPEINIAGMMQNLRRRGFSLALDDFGTGQANMKYLQNFPFNYLKIDRSFVRTIGTGAIIESLNQGIIQIARSLHLEIIAEGVETAEQLEYFIENQVRYVQGWFFGKAMPYQQFAKLFLESHAQGPQK